VTLAGRVQAQAKINLYLWIAPAMPDGYHLLSTEFLRIDLADDVEIRLAGTARSLDATGPSMPSGGLGPIEKNLAYRAAVEYLKQNGRGLPTGFEIHLHKRIPVGGGLGGGSADAGGVLRVLQKLSPNPLDAEALRQLAAGLGADVPFLASELTTACGMGRGDLLVGGGSGFPPTDVLLIVPSFSIGTAEAYRWLDEDRGPQWQSFHRQRGDSVPWPGFQGYADDVNDFEPTIERRFPKIMEYRELLKSKGATVARMSGSGSTVFGIFDMGAPSPESLNVDGSVIATRTSTRVVQVEVLQ
jgi:4-diphosphocytidyl-2-C-methyl-D-erythritol kinase